MHVAVNIIYCLLCKCCKIWKQNTAYEIFLYLLSHYFHLKNPSLVAVKQCWANVYTSLNQKVTIPADLFLFAFLSLNFINHLQIVL